jgi:nitrite reductase (cytochrome c-552)
MPEDPPRTPPPAPSNRSSPDPDSQRPHVGARPPRGGRRPRYLAGAVVVLAFALITVLIAGLLVSIFQRRQEARHPFVRQVEVTEDTMDPAIWGINWPHQYESFQRTVDTERTRYGGSDAIPVSKLEATPWLQLMWSGHAFSIDYRQARGHYYSLVDQEETGRHQRPQPGACLHCHAASLAAYRFAGEGDVFAGFMKVNAMPYQEARNLTDPHGNLLINHPVSCVDCHDPQTMDLRVTRPAFILGIQRYMASQGVPNFDPNRDATRQQMRTFTCAQCHVEYYFRRGDNKVVYPWHNGLRVEEMEAYYDQIGFSDWTHGITGGGMLKAQHPEFELFMQGSHARAGVSCADCHMPYIRVGAMKVSDHQVRSPLLNIAHACQTCHRVPESELRARAETIQERHVALVERAGAALSDMIHEIAAAREEGATPEQLAPAVALQRRAQWRLDFIYSENSHGFHAPQEAARVLAESIDYARQGQALARGLRAPGRPAPPLTDPQPVEGATETERAPPAPGTGREPRPGVRP